MIECFIFLVLAITPCLNALKAFLCFMAAMTTLPQLHNLLTYSVTYIFNHLYKSRQIKSSSVLLFLMFWYFRLDKKKNSKSFFLCGNNTIQNIFFTYYCLREFSIKIYIAELSKSDINAWNGYFQLYYLTWISNIKIFLDCNYRLWMSTAFHYRNVRWIFSCWNKYKRVGIWRKKNL